MPPAPFPSPGGRGPPPGGCSVPPCGFGQEPAELFLPPPVVEPRVGGWAPDPALLGPDAAPHRRTVKSYIT